MTLNEFWEHIAKTKRKDTDAHTERLVARLAKLKIVETLDFGHWWNQCLRDAYHWNLWGAANLINGGCSDDGFDYFCQWLILQGRDVFKAALKKPDSLAKVVDPEEEIYECYCSPASDAWFVATGLEATDQGYAALHAAEAARHGERKSLPELDEGWDFEDDAEIRKRLPRLAELYLDGDD